MTQEEQTKWGSHLPPLLACLAATTGPVLELGVGHFSTPALHAYCLTANRRLVSAEQNERWFTEFQSRYESNLHDFYHGEYDILLDGFTVRWGVAFIDESPGGERRAKSFAALLPVSDFVVVHDCEETGDNYPAILPLLKGANWHLCTAYFPHTLCASKNLPIPKAVIEM